MLNEEKTEAIAALADPLRRRLFDYVRNAGRPVTRDEAAKIAGISRNLAAFHLDKLVERGLLTADYARPEGRSGPGAGRPPKVYEPAEVEVGVSIPERRYDFIGNLLVDSILADNERGDRAAVAADVAANAGRAIGETVRDDLHLRPPGVERTLATAAEVLRARGYEPYTADRGEVRLRNCPFHQVARRAPELVCTMNRAFVEGIVRGMGNSSVEAALDPTPGQCCVVLRRPSQAAR